jgi:hypothetical protein
MWAGRAGAYARSFAPLCGAVRDQARDQAEVTDGTRMLDVGTGTGTLAAAAADLMRDLPAESVARIRAAYDRAIADRADGDGRVGLRTSALLARGTRPVSDDRSCAES